MSEKKLPEPFGMSMEEFLVGPDGDYDSLDIDDIFGKRLQDVMDDMLLYAPESAAYDISSPRRPSHVAEGYYYIPVEAGIVLFASDDKIAGAYLSCDVVVDDIHQGLGLGAEIIVERALSDAALPTWWLDVPAYTRAGLAAHQSAWSLSRSNPEMIIAKAARIAEENSSPAISP